MIKLHLLFVLFVYSLLIYISHAYGENLKEGLGDCDPLDPFRCYLPFPNNFWLRLDNNTQTYHMQYSVNTFPVDIHQNHIDPQAGDWNSLDGVSPITNMLTYFANIDLDASNVARIWNISHSLTHLSPTVLLDTETGEVVPHYVELDHRSDELFPNGSDPNAYSRLLMLWPTQALVNGRRYIVAMRSLVNTTNQPIIPSVAFTALRDNISTHDPNVELRRQLFENIFSMLENAGWERSSLQLAWDFTIASRSNIQDRLLFIRDDAFARIPAGGPSYTIDSVDDNFSNTIYRRIKGTMHVPLYLTSYLPNTSFVLNAQGQPVYQGLAPANFTVLIPRSLVQNATIGSVLQYGHGLFGSQDEVQSGYLTAEANEYGYVLIATNWWGLDENDVIYVAYMLGTDLTNFKIVPDRCAQGMLNALLAMKMITGSLAQDPVMIINNHPVIDSSSSKYYTGNSQGGILGSVYMAVSTDVQRGVLGVAGGPYSMLLPRSVDFDDLYRLMSSRYTDPVDLISLLTILQGLWDRSDPGGYIGYISNPPPNTPSHQVIVHYGVGDAQVSYLGAYIIGRSVQASMFQSNVKVGNETLFGFKFIPDSATSTTSMIVGWEFAGVDPVPEVNIPPNKATDVHECVRRQTTAQKMMANFFFTGVIENTCGGVCSGTCSFSSDEAAEIEQHTSPRSRITDAIAQTQLRLKQ